jgi:hypothetical protein
VCSENVLDTRPGDRFTDVLTRYPFLPRAPARAAARRARAPRRGASPDDVA